MIFRLCSKTKAKPLLQGLQVLFSNTSNTFQTLPACWAELIQKPRCYFATVSRTTTISITEDARKRDWPNSGGQFQQSSWLAKGSCTYIILHFQWLGHIASYVATRLHMATPCYAAKLTWYGQKTSIDRLCYMIRAWLLHVCSMFAPCCSFIHFWRQTSNKNRALRLWHLTLQESTFLVTWLHMTTVGNRFDRCVPVISRHLLSMRVWRWRGSYILRGLHWRLSFRWHWLHCQLFSSQGLSRTKRKRGT